MLLILILAGVLLFGLPTRKQANDAGASSPTGSRRTPRTKGPLSPYWFAGALLIGVVLLRFGVNWLVVAGGMLVAVLRSVAPLIRLLPLFQSLRRGTFGGGTGESSSAYGAGAGGSSPRAPRMTRHEALQVLGLDEHATAEDVQREYRRLMRKVHPDLGGSGYLAAKLNEAKDVLS